MWPSMLAVSDKVAEDNSGYESSLHMKAWFTQQQIAYGYSQLQNSILFLILGAT